MICTVLAGLMLESSQPSLCTPVPNVIEQAEEDLLNLRLTTFLPIQDSLEQAWACNGIGIPSEIAHAWLLNAAHLSLNGQNEDAFWVWRAAAQVSPETWNPRLGTQFFEQYQHAHAESLPDSSRLAVSEVLPRSIQIVIDGQVQALPAEVSPGPHVVQAIHRNGRTVAASIIRVSPNETVELHLGDFVQAPARRPAIWRIPVSGAAAGLSIGAAFLAKSQDSVMRQANTQAELNQAFTRQKAMAIASYGLGGLALTGSISWAFY